MAANEQRDLQFIYPTKLRVERWNLFFYNPDRGGSSNDN